MDDRDKKEIQEIQERKIEKLKEWLEAEKDHAEILGQDDLKDLIEQVLRKLG
jgi:hypothetical protein